MGSKTKAREVMQAAGVPIVPGTTDPVETVDDARKIIADSIGHHTTTLNNFTLWTTPLNRR